MTWPTSYLVSYQIRPSWSHVAEQLSLQEPLTHTVHALANTRAHMLVEGCPAVCSLDLLQSKWGTTINKHLTSVHHMHTYKDAYTHM